MPRTPRENPWPRALGVSLAVHLLLLLVPLTTEVAAEDALALVELVPLQEPEALPPRALEGAGEASPPEPQPAPGERSPDEAELAQTTEDPEPVEASSPEEPPPAELQHVRFSEDVRASDEVPDTHRIASKDVVVQRDARAPQPILAEGPLTPAQLGAPGTVGAATPQKTQDLDAERGRDGEAERVARKRAAHGPTTDDLVDGHAGSATAAGPASLAERDGGREGLDKAGAGARPRSLPSAGLQAAEVLGQEPSSPLGPDPWEPFAVRIDPSAGQPAPSMEASEVETERRQPDEQVQQAEAERRPRESGDAGEVVLRSPEPLDEEEEAPAVAQVDDAGEDLEHLDRSWGGEQVERRNVQQGATGTTALSGQTATAPPLVVERTVDEAAETLVEARFDPMSPYMDEIEAVVDARWKELTPLEVRAMGLQGTAVVDIEIDARGRVVHKELARRSGYAEIDEIALASVPKRVKRPPQGAAEPTFKHSLEFRHTDRWASVN